MGLYERLIGTERPKLGVHPFCYALGERVKGQVTSAQIVSAFGLSVDETTEMETLYARLTAPTDEGYAIGSFNTLTNIGTTFDAIPATKGLGILAVQTNGITQADWRGFYQRTGSGTITWDLFNQTDTTSLVQANDDGVAGTDKSITVTFTPAQPLGAGIKLIRPRVKSTTAADDITFYGGSIRIQRLAQLRDWEVHAVLVMAEVGAAPYDTVAAIKTRLGV
jgi:hypothetical protein